MTHIVRDVTFISGRAGVCALGAVVAKFMEDEELMNSYLIKFKEVSSMHCLYCSQLCRQADWIFEYCTFGFVNRLNCQRIFLMDYCMVELATYGHVSS